MNDAEDDIWANAFGCGWKRKVNVDNWKKSKPKRARNSGKEYFSYCAQKHITAPKVCLPWKDQCLDKVGHDNIEVIFNNFWNMKEYDIQNYYLSKLVSSTDIQHTRIKARPGCKLKTINYTVVYDNKSFNVCRTAFYNNHGITEKRVHTVLDKQTSTGGIDRDQHGLKASAN